MLSYLPGMQRRQPIRAQHIQTENTAPSTLQTLLNKGEYGAFRNAPLFDSTFVEVNKKGQCVNINNHPNLITMGVLANNTSSALPNHLVIAQELDIKRMIPLEMLDIFVHNLMERRLKVRLISGKTYYLQLYAPEKNEDFLFERWIQLLSILKSTRGSVTNAMTRKRSKRKVSFQQGDDYDDLLQARSS